ncbi:feruloyl esterase B-2 [Penicillium nucicola]|uniref:feruloyl esterase B-2 n=1 Tax=Penicillium nucicola TaxID=1850975 RepID=UPI00254504C7|nr:feruloyl esterase B-2 [Penicillium nucicola]KAJ5747018.1 feruloyl esterase B-2 [Penicillium nucicola]
MKFSSLVVVLGLAGSTIGDDSFQQSCDSMIKKINISNVHVHFVDYVPAGTNLTFPDRVSSCSQGPQPVSVDLCRVAMAVATSNDSQISLEAWLPRNYTGRFLSTGNGGLGGCIQYYDLAYAASLGFAVVGANNGHNGTSGEPFFRHPAVVEDFAYRSIHTGVVVGKELTKSFYPQGFKKSYYLGCSTGGRQGFKSVQRFPHDFDGVVAGAPAMNFINLISWVGHFYRITGSNETDTYLSPALWSVVHEEITRQCDGMDGAIDGIIENPDLCHPVIDTLICNPSSNQTACLSGAQAHTVRQVLSPMYSQNGTLLYPRMQPGSELVSSQVLYTGQPFSFSTDWFRYVTYSDPNWNPASLDVHAAHDALEQNPYDIQTWDADLSSFQSAGGKLLSYHGTQDYLISSENSKLYYSRVAEEMNMSPSELDDFYRFFPISGMSHCISGTGASLIGNTAQQFSGTDPEDNVLMAMVKWVEEGIAPETVRRSKNGDNGELLYRRKHCKWPKRNVHVGPGNYTDENSWQCV